VFLGAAIRLVRDKGVPADMPSLEVPAQWNPCVPKAKSRAAPTCNHLFDTLQRWLLRLLSHPPSESSLLVTRLAALPSCYFPCCSSLPSPRGRTVSLLY
jgi:hypothetical protein